MRLSVLPLLACPAPAPPGAGRSVCGGSLRLHAPAGLPLRPAERDPEELREGGLLCSSCGTEFPVLSGVAVLVPRPLEYLRRHHRSVLRDLERHGDVSPRALAWLSRRVGAGPEQEEYGADFRFSQQFEEPHDVARAFSPEPEALYGPFAAWLRQIRGQGPYDVLARWARERTRERHLLLDAGCGGGGLLARAAPAFASAFGVDFSFLAVLLARRALLHRPEPERSYYLTVRRGQEVERPLLLPRADNAELLVGDCRALPFPAGLFDTVCSSNVIDIAGIEAPLDETARLLRPGGLLLLSDPFYFRDGEAPEGDPREAVHAALAARGLDVEAIQDAVPWAWATYDRHWRVYVSYCLAARRSGAGPAGPPGS